MNEGSYSIVVADHHPIIRKGLKGILADRPDFKIIGEASDGPELLRMLKGSSADLIILDISLPNFSGIDVIQEIKRLLPGAKVLILTIRAEREFVREAFSAGADGYLLKEDQIDELLKAIDAIRHNRFYISSKLLEDSKKEWVQMIRGTKREALFEPLTPRQRQILKLICQGKSNKEISKILFISVHTVERHRANIMNKLNMRRTADLVNYCIRHGLLMLSVLIGYHASLILSSILSSMG